MMAPYTYRSQLTLPKLLVNGTNDPYWVIDAQKLYWSDLQGPRYTLFLANADHDLNDQRQKALQTNAVFGQMVACNRQMPQLEWDSQQDGRKLTVRMKSDRKPVTAVLWSGQSQTTDF